MRIFSTKKIPENEFANKVQFFQNMYSLLCDNTSMSTNEKTLILIGALLITELELTEYELSEFIELYEFKPSASLVRKEPIPISDDRNLGLGRSHMRRIIKELIDLESINKDSPNARFFLCERPLLIELKCKPETALETEKMSGPDL